MIETRVQQLRATLKRLTAIHAAEMSVPEKSIPILQAKPDILSRSQQPIPAKQDPDTQMPIIRQLIGA